MTRTDQDNFARPDANPINGSWAAVTGGGDNCQIVSERVRASATAGGGSNSRWLNPISGNQTSTVKVISFSASAAGAGQVRVYARLQTTAWSGYCFIAGGTGFGSVSATLYRVDAGSFVSIASGSNITLASGDELSVDCQGSTIRGLHNGVQIYSTSSSTYLTGYPGIGVFVDTGNALSTVEIDDWHAEATHFPVAYHSNTTNGTTATTTPAINLPEDTRSDVILLAMIRVAVAGAIGWPAGWNELVDASPDGADDQISIAWKQYLGTEGATATLSSGSGKFSSVAYLIYGGSFVQPPQLSTVAIGTNDTPDPTAVTPTGGSKDYLIIWAGSWEGEQTSPPAAAPTSYSGMIAASSGTAAGITTNSRCVFAWREVTGTSEDPGSLTISVADDWAAYAIAIHPHAPIEPPRVVLSAVPHSFNW